MKNNFDTVCIIGLGLIGGSIGLSMKKNNFESKIIGYAKTEKTLFRAVERGLVDESEKSLIKAVDGADLVILATPLSTFKSIIEEIAPFLKKGSIVTDTGSAKFTVLEELKDLIPNEVEFVQSKNFALKQGSSPKSLVNLAKLKNYHLVANTLTNLFFVHESINVLLIVDYIYRCAHVFIDVRIYL